MACHAATFLYDQAKPIRKYGKIQTHLIHLDDKNLIIITL